MRLRWSWQLLAAALLLAVLLPAGEVLAAGPPAAGAHTTIWLWSLSLFVFCVVLGTGAVVAGVGGGVLYVPLVDAFFPFGLDFVRGAGLVIAVAGSLSSGPELLRRNLAHLRLAVPLGATTGLGAVLGARVGLSIPAHVIQMLLGVVIMAIALLMTRNRREGAPEHTERDPLAEMLGMAGSFVDGSSGELHHWHAQRVPLGLLLTFAIGIIGGVFGVGGGWALVPTLTLVMGVPLKVASASSVMVISLSGVAGAWVYLNAGNVLPVMVAPSAIGLMLGAKLGARLLDKASPRVVRRVVVAVLVIAGIRSLLAGLGIV